MAVYAWLLLAFGVAGAQAPEPTVILGSGKPATKEVAVSGFTAVEVDGAFQVEVSRADRFQVSITADDNLLDFVRVEREGRTLKIGMASGQSYRLDRGSELRAVVTMPALEAVSLHGAVRGTVKGYRSVRDMRLQVSGASRLGGEGRVADLRVEASGASRVTWTGSGRTARVEASGASRVDLEEFPADEVEVRLSGASRAGVDARRRLAYAVSGASHLEYRGDPSIERRERSGASTARRVSQGQRER